MRAGGEIHREPSHYSLRCQVEEGRLCFPHPAEHAFLKDNYLVQLRMYPRVNVKSDSPGLKAD